jgi:hypothetical protein
MALGFPHYNHSSNAPIETAITGRSKALWRELKEFPPPRELHYGIAEHPEILGAVNS